MLNANKLSRACAFVLALAALPEPAWAGDVYARVPLPQLKLLDGELPTARPWADAGGLRMVDALQPYAELTGPGEAFLAWPANGTLEWTLPDLSQAVLAVRSPLAQPVHGRLVVAEEGGGKMRAFAFEIDAAALSEAGQSDFYSAKAEHYENLAARNLPGAAWFRYLAARARAASGSDESAATAAQRALQRPPVHSLDDAFEMFTGSRAVAENLQLDRSLPLASDEPASVELSSLRGVEIAAYDWTAEIAGEKPALDRLASLVPVDQHALFFPTFPALTELSDELDSDLAPLAALYEARAEDAFTRARYERQLCLPLSTVARVLGPVAVRSIAITGSDPYLRAGSDLALLFEAPVLAVLESHVGANHEAAAKADPGVEQKQGTIAGVQWTGVRSPDRHVSSYMARLGDDVLAVTNSLAQLERLVRTSQGGHAALASAPETTFFRKRYVRGAEGEQALLILSDEAIRAWSGPRLRIADARRTQALAWLMDAQSAWIDQSAALDGEERQELPNTLPDGTPLEWDAHGVHSPVWGDLEFLTPALELDLERVKPGEAQAYERFRSRYQAGWRGWFDPIAVRLSRRGGALEADLSVRPLIAGTDYREWQRIIGDSKLAPRSGDPHPGTLAHLAFALDRRSSPFRSAESMLSGPGRNPGDDLFDWLGTGIGVYVEPDPFFDEWRAAKAEDEDDVWLEQNFMRVPLVLHMESENPVRLAAFLVSLRAFITQAAPDMTRWETRTHGEHTYSAILVDMRGLGGEPGLGLYYATLPGAWVLSPREDLLRRALDRFDRREARRSGAANADAATQASSDEVDREWLGESMALHLDGGLVDVARDLMGEQARALQQGLAWRTLPILREWQRHFPGQDPVDVHERLFRVRLLDPAGGRFESGPHGLASSLYGSPLDPRAGPCWSPAVESLREVDLGVTFEHQGLRARGSLSRK